MLINATKMHVYKSIVENVATCDSELLVIKKMNMSKIIATEINFFKTVLQKKRQARIHNSHQTRHGSCFAYHWRNRNQIVALVCALMSHVSAQMGQIRCGSGPWAKRARKRLRVHEGTRFSYVPHVYRFLLNLVIILIWWVSLYF